MKQEARRADLVAKVVASAQKKKYPLPDLTAMTYADLKALRSVIKHAHAG